jgi:thiol:disulfide interchange protein DsbD
MTKQGSLFLILFLSLGTLLTAQKSMVAWSYQTKKVSASEFDLIFTADVQPGWYIYSQFIGDNGPIPTSFQYDAASKIQFVGKCKETGYKKEGYDAIFGMNVIKFGKTVTFTQRVKANSGVKAISGTLTYMTCDDEQCLPPTDVAFSFVL